MQNRKALRLLFLANAISGFSQGISMLAIPWYFARSSQESVFNLAYGLITLVSLVWGIYAGALVDRFSRKYVFLILNIVCGALVGYTAINGYAHGGVSSWHIILVFGVTLLNYNMHYPALYAFSQELTEEVNYSKMNSNIEVVGQTTSILSGGLAALLLEGMNFTFDVSLAGLHLVLPVSISSWPVHKIFAIDAFTYLLACLLILFIRYKPIRVLQVEYGSILLRIRSGFGFLKRNKPVLWFGLFSYSVFACLLVELFAVLPAYVEKHLHKPGYVFAVADTVYAAGAVLAGLFAARAFQKNHTRGVIVLTFITAAIFYWCAASRAVWILYTVSLILGFTNAGIRVLRLTYIFTHVPNELIGRVNSIFNMSNILIRSLLIFIFSSAFFQAGSNSTRAYAVLASFALLSGFVLIFNSLRKRKNES